MATTRGSRAESKMNKGASWRPALSKEGSKVQLTLALSHAREFLEVEQQIQDMRVLILEVDGGLEPGTIVDVIIGGFEIGEVSFSGRAVYQMGRNTALVPDMSIPTVKARWEEMLQTCREIADASPPPPEPEPEPEVIASEPDEPELKDSAPLEAEAETPEDIVGEDEAPEAEEPEPEEEVEAVPSEDTEAEESDEAPSPVEAEEESAEPEPTPEDPYEEKEDAEDSEEEGTEEDAEEPDSDEEVEETEAGANGEASAESNEPGEEEAPSEGHSAEDETPSEEEPSAEDAEPKEAAEATVFVGGTAVDFDEDAPPREPPPAGPGLARPKHPFTSNTVKAARTQIVPPKAPPSKPPTASLADDTTRAELLHSLTSGQAITSGRIGERKATAWLIETMGRKENGVLTLQTQQGMMHLLFKDGYPIDAQLFPDASLYALRTLITQTRQVSDEKLKLAVEQENAERRDLGEVLMEMGELDDERLQVMRQIRLKFMIGLAMGTTSGNCFYHSLELLPYHIDITSPHIPFIANATLKKAIEAMDHTTLQEIRESRGKTYAVKIEPPPLPLEDFGFTSKEEHFYKEVLGGGRRLWETMTISNLNRSVAIRFLLRLEGMGLIAFQESIDINSFEIKRAESVKERAEAVGRSTTFEVLGIHWTAYRKAVEDGYIKQKAIFSPSNYPDSVQDMISTDLVKIQIAIETAYAKLINAQARAAYREEIITPQMIINTIDLFAQQADMAFWRGENHIAHNYYKRILEMEPRNQLAKDRLKEIKGLTDGELS